MPVDRRAKLVSSLLPLLALTLGAFPPAKVYGGIAGFNNLNPTDWTYNQSDGGVPAAMLNPETIQITSNLSGGQARSVFHNTPQPIDQFTATFTYQASGVRGLAGGQGITFTLQNDPRDVDALGSFGGSLGYGGGSNSRIRNSAAVTLDLANVSGLFFDGVIGSGSPSVAPINLLSGHAIDVTLTYDGFFLHETLVDTVSLASYSPPPLIVGDLSSRVGGPTAFIGFTASTTGDVFSDGVNQYISNFTFVPEPATLSMLVLGSAALLRKSRTTIRRR